MFFLDRNATKGQICPKIYLLQKSAQNGPFALLLTKTPMQPDGAKLLTDVNR